MKRILMLIMAALFLSPAVFAGDSNRSTLRIRLSDGSPLMLTVNGRQFKKIGRSITIGDLHGKRQDLQVYRYRQYSNGNGGRSELVFNDRIKIEKGGTYDCIVDIGSGKISISEVQASLPPLPQPPPFDPNRSHTLNNQRPQNNPASNDDVQNNAPLEMPPVQNVSAGLQSLKTAMAGQDADSKKLEFALNYVNRNQVNSQDVGNIAAWIFFDDNRMKFVKQAYSKVSDKNNYASVGKVFTMSDSKREFDDFLNKQ
jgi:hypothetical protein